MIIDVYTFCWNEEVRLPYFLRLWSPIARRIIIYDNGSTDKSKEIASQYKNVVWDSVTYGNGQIDDWRLAYIKNNCWKQNRDSDLCFVGDMDEIMYHPSGLHNFLQESYALGFTVFLPLGYDMISQNLPKHTGQIWEHEDFKHGIESPGFNKMTIFSPKHIKEMNYYYGAHECTPTGNVKVFKYNHLKLLHYKMINIEYYLKRHKQMSKRVSDVNKQNGWGIQYSFRAIDHKIYFDEVYKNREKVVDI